MKLKTADLAVTLQALGESSPEWIVQFDHAGGALPQDGGQ